MSTGREAGALRLGEGAEHETIARARDERESTPTVDSHCGNEQAGMPFAVVPRACRQYKHGGHAEGH